MAAPIDADWARNDLSPANLNKTTSGQGTSFPSTWPTDRLFWRIDTNLIYKNTGTVGTPVWTSLNGLLTSGSIYPITPLDDSVHLIRPTHRLWHIDTGFGFGGVNGYGFKGYRTDDGGATIVGINNWNATSPQINDDFTAYVDTTEGDLFYPTTATARLRVDPTNDELDFTHPNIVATDTCKSDTNQNLSDTAFVMRIGLTLSTLTGGAGTGNTRFNVGLFSASDYSSQDGIMWSCQILLNVFTHRVRVLDGATPTNGTLTTVSRALSTETIYIQIIRTSATTGTFQLFSNSSYTINLEGPTAISGLAATVTGLKYVGVTLETLTTTSNNITGQVLDVAVKNGVTSW